MSSKRVSRKSSTKGWEGDIVNYTTATSIIRLGHYNFEFLTLDNKLCCSKSPTPGGKRLSQGQALWARSNKAPSASHPDALTTWPQLQRIFYEHDIISHIILYYFLRTIQIVSKLVNNAFNPLLSAFLNNCFFTCKTRTDD